MVGNSVQNSLGLYIHLPFCARRCGYCDFYSQAWQPAAAADLHNALLVHMQTLSPEAQNRPLHSIYIGGGTPSIWPAGRLADLLEQARACFCLPPHAEITLEANPGSVSPRKADHWLAAGVNRLSIGIQTFQPELLSVIQRRQDPAAAAKAVRAARQAGCANLSLDLIYGLPGQTPAQARQDISQALELEPQHLSLYELTLSPQTALGRLYRKYVAPMPGEDMILQMENQAAELCAGFGLRQYEISNFARPGCHCRHNTATWQGGDYLALGPGGHGHLGNQRFAWASSVEEYIRQVQAGQPVLAFSETLTPRQQAQEIIMLGLRTVQGVDWNKIRAFSPDFSAALREIEASGWAVWDGNFLKPTAEGLKLADQAAELFF